MLVLMLSALAAYAQPPQTPTNSAASSPSSGTPVESERGRPRPQSTQSVERGLISACNAAADELRASRILIDALEAENAALKGRLETERRSNTILTELNETRRAENEALRVTVAAKNETIAAKDAALAAQNNLIETLKTKKRSIWSRVGDILIGAAAVAILK